MIRHRAPVEGGYDRTTITLPSDVVQRMKEHIKERSGLTISAYITKLLEKALKIVRKV